jgi:hypothetical protein
MPGLNRRGAYPVMSPNVTAVLVHGAEARALRKTAIYRDRAVALRGHTTMFRRSGLDCWRDPEVR